MLIFLSICLSILYQIIIFVVPVHYGSWIHKFK